MWRGFANGIGLHRVELGVGYGWGRGEVGAQQYMAILDEGLWQHMDKSSIPKDDMVL